MDVTVAKKDLLRFVARAQAIADKKSTMPVLSNVLLETTGKTGLSVSATDLYLSIAGTVAAEVRKGGSVAVPARDLLERVKAMPDGPLQLTSEAGGATVLRGSGTARRYTLRSQAAGEFPKLPRPAEDAARFEIGANVLSALIGHTQFSISPDDTRPNLNSALFEWQGDRVRMVTTDGHRLSKAELTVTPAAADATLLLPLKAVVELRRMAEEAGAEGKGEGKEGGKAEAKDAATSPGRPVVLTASGPNAFFEVGGALFGVKLVDAQFPSYQQVIPQQSERSARVPRLAFADALRAVSLAASERTGGVKLTLSKGLMRITSESPESGDGLDEIPVDYAGKDVTIGFNAKYFLDVLGAMDDEDEVTLGFSGELDPAVLRPASERPDRQYIAVIMPMRI
ncbi:MAG: DNA polymerase III subunit beta [Polyangiaceae bacterium]|jgi:DNA polymerase III subunit beta|nr:DNA polymerase III subunit beta [Polyangiaceae bacterium]